MRTINVDAARRLALARSGLLKPEWTGLPQRAAGRGKRARAAAHTIINRFGYLQLDSVSIAGARSHVIVLLSRLENFDPRLGEDLLQPGEPLFEFWGHEACWLPLSLYPLFEFRRQRYRHHPWFGDVIGEYPDVAQKLIERITNEGQLRSVDFEGPSEGWWDLKPMKKVALALWSCGELAISSRHNFQRSFDLRERVIPSEFRDHPLELPEALRPLLLRALCGHGWATKGTLCATWRLKKLDKEVKQALAELRENGNIEPCRLTLESGRNIDGWIRPQDLELAARLKTIRPQRSRGVLLSPFDPVLWDRGRVQQLFDFEQILEIYKPAAARRFGYYCLPVLAGDRLVARVDLKFDRPASTLNVLSCHYEASGTPEAHEAVTSALGRYSRQLGCEVRGVGSS